MVLSTSPSPVLVAWCQSRPDTFTGKAEVGGVPTLPNIRSLCLWCSAGARYTRSNHRSTRSCLCGNVIRCFLSPASSA